MTPQPPIEPERWQRLSTLFDELAELGSASRARRLEEIAGTDPDLAGDLERLLAADGAAEELLDTPLELASPPDEESAAVEPPPARAGPYRIVGLLGRGGMAEVYSAERDDGSFEQRVAVKVVRRGLDTEDLLARFLAERRILARLEHPAIARLFDGGALADGRPYLVMERVDGEPIHRYAEERGLPVEARLRLLLVACDAVAYAHRNLVVHRDLKPSNVLVSASGEVKLLDFGIAKLLAPDAAAPQTVGEARVLTPAYAAPEQLSGGPTTTATDVWGLGALGFELLVGEPPLAKPRGRHSSGPYTLPAEAPPRASARVLELSAAGPEGRRRAARLHGDLDTILQKALAIDPARRYPSVEALAEDLHRHLDGRPVRARPDSLGYRASRFVRRHRTAAAAGALGILSLAVGGGIALWQARVAARERARPLPLVRYATYSGHDSSPAVSPDGGSIAFCSRRDGRSRIWLARIGSGNEMPLTAGEDDYPRFAPDGKEVLFARRQQDRVALFAVPAGGGEPRRRIPDALFGDYSPDGRRICFLRQASAGGRIVSIVGTARADGGDVRELARLPGRVLVPPRWSPDGRTIAVIRTSLDVGARTVIALVDAERGALRILAPAGASPRGIAWVGPTRLAYSQPDTVLGWVTGASSRLVVDDLAADAMRTVFSSPTSVAAFDLSPPTALVFTASSFRVDLQEIDLRDPAASRRWLTHGDSSDRQPSYGPDSEWVVYSSNRGGNLDLWAVSRRSGASRRLTNDPALDWDPAYTPDGKLLWSTDRGGHFEIWEGEADGRGARQISRDGVDAENPTATPDGKWILYVSSNPATRGIVRMRRDGSQPTLVVPGSVSFAEVSPDGRYVAFVDVGGETPALRVARIADGTRVDFELPLPLTDPAADPDVGRCRWFPDGRSLAVISRETDGTFAVERYSFAPEGQGQPVAGRLLALEPNFAAESLGISPDGNHLTVAYWDHSANLMLAENVWGLAR